ncbi:hypothetical protein K474DRAFT_966435 [Panus rudis PR-1116 ss-1]|nr:hypothetical protein K474DRAFT_966435 [Panus rudis PR-1116 ss-1]
MQPARSYAKHCRPRPARFGSHSARRQPPSSMLHDKVVLWPEDLRESQAEGFLIGWSSPLICVAGVLKAQEAQQAEDVLNELCRKLAPSLSRISAPEVLGRCTASDNVLHIVLEHDSVIEQRDWYTTRDQTSA